MFPDRMSCIQYTTDDIQTLTDKVVFLVSRKIFTFCCCYFDTIPAQFIVLDEIKRVLRKAVRTGNKFAIGKKLISIQG